MHASIHALMVFVYHVCVYVCVCVCRYVFVNVRCAF